MSVFETRISVRFRDLDAMGHVNHAVFFTYFAEGRNKLFFDFFKISDPSAFPLIMAHVSCDYLKPIQLIREVLLWMWVRSIGKKSFTLGYKLLDPADKNIVYAKGESVQVCYNYSQNEPMEVSGELREELRKYLLTGRFPDLDEFAKSRHSGENRNVVEFVNQSPPQRGTFPEGPS